MESEDKNWNKKVLLTALGVVVVGVASYYVIKGMQTEEAKSINKANQDGSEAENSEEVVSIDEEEDQIRKEKGRLKIVQRKSTGY